MQKAKDRYHNRAEYYIENKDVLRENAKNEFRSLFEEKKGTKREYGRNRCRNMTKNKKNKLKVYQTKYKVAKK